MQHFHHQMRLAEGRAARYRGAHSRRDVRIKKVDIEADMQQAVGRRHTLQKGPEQGRDAVFIDGAHVVHRDMAAGEEGTLRLIDAADAEHADIGTIKHCRQRREDAGKARFTQRVGHRHAMQVAALGAGQRMAIGMGIKPEHEQGPAQGSGA
jgi:hypothetical protein